MNVLRNNRGNAMPLAIAITLSLLLIMCGIFEYLKLLIITTGIRDAVQSAVIATITENYDDSYSQLRDGYSGGYFYSDKGYYESIDIGNIYGRLDRLLGLETDGTNHIKYAGGHSVEYILSNLDVEMHNTALAPGGSGQSLTANIAINVKIPVSFANKTLPPLTLTLWIGAAYIPKF